MAEANNVTRRALLIGSVAIAGGVAFGLYAVRRPYENPLLDGLDPGEAAITPFVKIDANGVTLIAPRADFGQGARSIQAYLISEDLDVDPHTVNVEPGPVGSAYYNSVLFDEAGPFPAYKQGFVEERTRDAFGAVAKLMALQMTGGSTTVPDMFDRLRKAGAVARETLKKAAARSRGVKVHELTTDNGAVVLPGGERIPYAALAEVAATVRPVGGAEPRNPSSWRFLGRPIRRTDIVAKSTGKVAYGIDLRFDGMLYATVRANPGLGAGVARYDASEAEAMRGVRKIVPITNGVGVIADNTWRAFKAAEAIQIDWEPGPYPENTDAMWSVLAETLDGGEIDSRMRDAGRVDHTLAVGDVVSAEYRSPYVAHAPMEPMNAVVKVTDKQVDIWTATQIPDRVVVHTADLTGISESNIFVHNQLAGGSFGRRLEDTYVMQAVELAMAVKGAPVKMTWSREEDMLHDYPRPMQMARGRGTVKEGRVEAYDLSIASQSLMASWFGRILFTPPGPDPTITIGAFDQPFAIPNYRVTGLRAPEMVPCSSWRSPGACTNGFFHECFLDELFDRAGADPLAERLRLCEHEVSCKVLETVGEMASWSGRSIGPARGRGLAFVMSHGVPCAEIVDVTNTPKGIRIDKVFVACDVGRILDPINFEAQVVGGVIWGLGHAMNCELTYENYAPQQTNYHAHEGMRLYQTPVIEVRGLENAPKIRGVGEPSVPPAAPALANAVFAATGRRLREMPFNKSIDFI